MFQIGCDSPAMLPAHRRLETPLQAALIAHVQALEQRAAGRQIGNIGIARQGREDRTVIDFAAVE